MFETLTLMMYKVQGGVINNPVISSGDGKYDEVSGNPLTPMIARVWKTLVVLGALLLVVYLVWGAFEWLSSSGEPEKLKHARYKMINAIIGLLILTASFALITMLKMLFGYDLLQFVWPTAPTS